MASALIGLGILVFAAHFFQAAFTRTRVPDVLPFFVIGLLIGPTSGTVTPETFGALGGVFAAVVLTIILFEGGLNLRIRDLLASMNLGSRLTLLSFAAALAIVPAVLMPLAGFTLLEGLMTGAILGGTSSAVVIPLARSLDVTERTRTGLLLESSLSDVLCIVVTLALAESLNAPELRPGLMLGRVLSSFLLAIVIGAGAGLLWSLILDRVRELDNSISTTPAFLLIAYGVAETLGFSGAITALAFGVTLGNISDLPVQGLGRLGSFRPVTISAAEKAVFAEVVFLLKAFFFVYVGVQIRWSDPAWFGAAALIAALIYAARVLIVRWSMPPDSPRADAVVAAVLGPKGLAAAVLAGVPLRNGFAHGPEIEVITFGVVFVTIVATSVLAFLLRGGAIRRGYDSLLRSFPEAP